MHELSLAQSLLEQLHSLADEHKADKITRVTVLLGPFSGVVADSFSFGFSILKKDFNKTREAELILETPPPEYYCLNCNQTSAAGSEHPAALQRAMPENPTCSHCGSDRLSPSGGSELILKQVEME